MKLGGSWLKATVLSLLSVGLWACTCDRTRRSSSTTAPPPAASALQTTGPSAERSLLGSSYLFVSNEGSNTVTAIDSTTDEAVTRIDVGMRPRGLQVSPDGRALYVALSGSPRAAPGIDVSKLPPPARGQDGIGWINLSRGRLVAMLRSGPDPEAFDVTPDGTMLYVSNEASAQATVLDIGARQIARTLSVCAEPGGVSVSPDGRFAYIACGVDDRVDVIHTARRVVFKSIPTSQRPRQIVFTGDGAHAYVSAESGSAVNVLDAARHERVATIPLPAEPPAQNGPSPMGLVLSPDQRTLYVTTGSAGGIAVIDTASRKVTRTFKAVGARPFGIAISHDGRKLYTANGPSDDVSVIDAESGVILKKIPTGRLPWDIVSAPAPAP
ncbi:MAG TPA: beta-propeller fold lactonase family protein [Polyangiaceae bacterium]